MELMKISAGLANQKDKHEVTLETNGRQHSLVISPKSEGFGSSTNGGELLFLALATCYCNGLCREAAKRGIEIEGLQVKVAANSEGKESLPATLRIGPRLRPRLQKEVLDLMRFTDTVAEIQNTLRCSSPIALAECRARDTR